MNQLSPQLRQCTDGHIHWCPGCEGTHRIPNTWTFDGKVINPTFTPSVRITWTWGPEHVKHCCHYIITEGKIAFQPDCTHKLVGQTVPLPPIPESL